MSHPNIGSGLPLPSTDDPMETDAPQSSAAPAAESGQDTEMTSEEPSSSAPPTSQAAAEQKAEDADAASYLPECITHTARLLESVFSNHDTCSKFVQQGGIEALLHLYKLPKLPPTFGSSSASHSLLASLHAGCQFTPSCSSLRTRLGCKKPARSTATIE